MLEGYTDIFRSRNLDTLSNSKMLTSRGAQPKENIANSIIKKDILGYEGLSEILAYRLLLNTNLVGYNHAEYYPNKSDDCISPNFLIDTKSVTLYKLITQHFSMDLKGIIEFYTNNYDIVSYSFYEFILECIREIVNYNAADFFSLLFEFDRLIVNTDRHFNNILFIQKSDTIEPVVFDCGAGFCSDLTLYTNGDMLADLKYALCKPFNEDFDRQVAIANTKSSRHLEFLTDSVDIVVSDLLHDNKYIQRVKVILEHQLEKYYPEVKVNWL